DAQKWCGAFGRPGEINDHRSRKREQNSAYVTKMRLAGHPRRVSPFSLTFSQIFRFVRRSPVASCLGSSLPGRKLSRLTPTNFGTPSAFLTGREKCGLAV